MMTNQKEHKTKRQSRVRLFLLFSIVILGGVIALVVPSLHKIIPHGKKPVVIRSEPGFDYTVVDFETLKGWNSDRISQAVPVFLLSCEKMKSLVSASAANSLEALGSEVSVKSFSGNVADWLPACQAAMEMTTEIVNDFEPFDYDNLAREFFESWFTPVRIRNKYQDTLGEDVVESAGKFTGYFEPVYNASMTRTSVHNAPLYARPDDLVEIDLGQFRADLAGQRLAGRVKGGRLYPYEDRAAINRGALNDKVPVLAWLSADDAFFLQIQGSGVLEFGDGSAMRVGFAGQNGHPYTAIGKPLVERGELSLDKVSLQTIRAWLEGASPAQAQALREENASYVFFTALDSLANPQLGPLGAQGVQLTPLRSLAADRRYHAMGTPVWVEIDSINPDIVDIEMNRLMIVQDTGGAIRGPVRGDFFWGRGDAAKTNAGVMNAEGSITALIPNAVIEKW